MKFFRHISLLLLLMSFSASHTLAGSGHYLIDNRSPEELDTETLPIDSLIKASQSMLYAQPKSAYRFARQALKKSIQQEDQEIQLKALNLLGSIHEVKSVHDSALHYFFRARAKANELEQYNHLGNSCNNIGVTYWSIGNYKDALINFFQALDYYALGQNEGSHANTLNNIGLIYADLENHNKAHQYYRDAYDVYKSQNDSIKMGAALTNIGTSYIHREQPDSALHYLEMSRVLKERTNDKYGLCISLEGLGNAWIAKSAYGKARELFLRGKQISDDIGFDYGKASAYLGLARVHLEKAENEQALESAKKAIQISDDTGSIKMEYQAHNIISEIYEQTGLHDKALDHYRQYNELKNESLDKNRLHQVYDLEMQHAAEENLREIERQELMLSRKNTILAFVSISFAAILVIIFLLYRLHLNKVRQREKEKLDAANLKLTEERTRAALEAEVAERKRLGFELHDGVGPLLSLAKLNVSALQQKKQLNPDRQLSILNNTERTINEVLKEMKQISNNMAPLILLEKGFEEAVRDLKNHLNQTGPYKVALEMIGLNGRMESYLEHALFRSIQEIINNVIKHANGSEINIQVIQGTEDLTVMVEDNGEGFNPEELKEHKGIGLKSAISRIRGLKGEFFIDSAKGRGTIVTFIIPIGS